METHADPRASERSGVALFLRAAAVEGSVDEETRSVRYVASTDQIDGHGTIVRQNWDTRRFTPRGVVLYAHCADELPIGTAAVSIQDGKLMADVQFSTEDLNPQAEQVWKNVKAGVIRGISPGFIPHTVTFEKHEDREVMVLDDNELFELSVTPIPSNASALAQMRSLATREAPHPEAAPVAASADPPPPAAVDETQPATRGGEIHMSENNKPAEPTNVISIARALELPAGATEQDSVAAAVRLRQLEVQVQALTGAESTAEAMGRLRAMKVDSDKFKATEAELLKVRAERDAQNFETLLAQGRADHKLTPAEEKYQRDLFAKDVESNRGAARVEELRGFLAVKSPDLRFARDIKQPNTSAGAGSPLVHEGKSYGDLSYSQRAALAKSNPELWKLMKADHEAQTA